MTTCFLLAPGLHILPPKEKIKSSLVSKIRKFADLSRNHKLHAKGKNVFNGHFITSLLSIHTDFTVQISQKNKNLKPSQSLFTTLFLKVIAVALVRHMTQSSLKTFLLRYSDTPTRVTLTTQETVNNGFITH